MRCLIALLLLILSLHPAPAAATLTEDSDKPEAGLKWMKDYHHDPKPQDVPALIRKLSKQGAFDEPQKSGVYVGFLAGVLRENPEEAVQLAADCLPLPFKDQWLVVRAIAYSGLDNWKQVMIDFAPNLPERKHLMRYYIAGKLPTLEQVPFTPPKASTLDKVRRAFRWETYFGPEKAKPVRISYATHPELIDVQWGLYFATGEDMPIAWIAALLPWSEERDSLDKLTAGGMAKFTLAVNASRDPDLLTALRRIQPHQRETVRRILTEVIIAAETADTARLREDVVGAIDELRQKGPGSRRAAAWWAEMGQVALSLGCVGASAVGQVALGVPCVVGGALSSAALRYLGSGS
ncbi:hypothetical protein [Dichotomicrobium thermohalophilum]|uniref:HEAT repeat protein n=1 Tax=Dichotomicrobium thermohalophilum TaxID=933063 RepID=A0A397QD30_9HYPH|nr:hypothetical protein [Dichotomicrobium thermohalophilum]RIA55994.1 hypothetical protein BXY53_1083 [Dichotomicrobium thermohalophilum]